MCQNRMDLKLIVMNNHCLGMIREIQQQSYGGRYTAVELDGGPDLPTLAGAYGIPAARLSQDAQIEEAVRAMLASSGPFLLECVVDPQEKTLHREKGEMR